MSLFVNNPPIIIQPTPVYYEAYAYVVAPQPAPMYVLPDLSKYCLCTSHEDSEAKYNKYSKESSELSTSSVPHILSMKKKIKKKNKALFKPMIIDRAERTLAKLLKLSDKN